MGIVGGTSTVKCGIPDSICRPHELVRESIRRGFFRTITGEQLKRKGATVAASRNAPCPCGSGKKYKHCHLGLDVKGMFE